MTISRRGVLGILGGFVASAPYIVPIKSLMALPPPNRIIKPLSFSLSPNLQMALLDWVLGNGPKPYIVPCDLIPGKDGSVRFSGRPVDQIVRARAISILDEHGNEKFRKVLENEYQLIHGDQIVLDVKLD